ncbi:MAG: hypothetical protein V1779_08925 [bacterium]
MATQWHFIDPDTCIPSLFGLKRLWAVKVKKHDGLKDVRSVYVLGDWKVYSELLEYDPVSFKKLKQSTWFIFAAKGE